MLWNMDYANISQVFEKYSATKWAWDYPIDFGVIETILIDKTGTFLYKITVPVKIIEPPAS